MITRWLKVKALLENIIWKCCPCPATAILSIRTWTKPRNTTAYMSTPASWQSWEWKPWSPSPAAPATARNQSGPTGSPACLAGGITRNPGMAVE